MKRTTCILIFVPALLALAISCHSSTDPILGPGGPTLPNPGGPASDLVRLTTRPVVGDVVTVDVVISGPSTNQSLGAFYFDLVLSNPNAVVLEEFEPGGNNVFGTSGWEAARLPLPDGHALSLVNKTGVGVGLGPGTFGLLTLSFRSLPGQTTEVRIERSTLDGDSTADPVARDIDGNLIDSIDWDPTPTLIQG